jgi:uncharacterized protein
VLVHELKMDGQVIISKCHRATGFFSRFMGLMGQASIPSDEAILFPNCNSIHTFFMRFPIDVIFLSEDGTIVEVLNAFRSWRMLVPRSGVRHTVEMKAGRASDLGIKPGRRLEWNKK